MAGDKLLNQNKAGRPHQLVVYVFSYVYGVGLSTLLISVVNSPLPDDQSICQPPSNFVNFSITMMVKEKMSMSQLPTFYGHN